MPKTFEQWLRFTAAVFVASIAISAVLRRVPQLAALAESV